jgi:hypothetical protein
MYWLTDICHSPSDTFLIFVENELSWHMIHMFFIVTTKMNTQNFYVEKMQCILGHLDVSIPS